MKTIADLKAKLAEATEGPWKLTHGRNGVLDVGPSHTCTVARLYHPPVGTMNANAELIVAMHAALPALLEIAEAAGELRQLQKIDRQPMASDWSAFDAVEARLDAALAKLEAP